MSGIIKEKWDMVRESAESAGFFLETHMVQGGMECLCLQENQGYFRCDWRLACNSICQGSAISPVTIEDKETSKHMFHGYALESR